MKTKAVHLKCPCESGQSYTQCCQPLHQGNLADSALILMRSRYSAYVLGLVQYLLRTWHSDTRPTVLNLEAEHIKWLGLEVLATQTTGPHTAMVEFVARYKVGGGRAERLHEVSEFIYTDAWYYVAGKHS